MPGLFGLSAANPLLLLGALSVASPIIIHLLARRRYRTIYWAAMDFLLDAQKRNRRRVQLEHLILLLLRCLIMILIALLLARLMFTPTGLAALALGTAEVERIVVLDDSPSMSARQGPRSAFDQAKARAIELVDSLIAQRGNNKLTLMLTSNPGRPLFSGEILNEEFGQRFREALEGAGGADDGLQPSDRYAQWAAALEQVRRHIDEQDVSPNRAVYLLTDLREHDFPIDEGEESGEDSVKAAMAALEPHVDSILIVDFGEQDTTNLAITDVQVLEKSIVRDRPTNFSVTVSNFGPTDATGATVRLVAAGAMITRELDAVPAGGEQVVNIPMTFVQTGHEEVVVELEFPDMMPADNTHHLAARVVRGVRILMVDGGDPDLPGAVSGRSEVEFLRHAVDPAGRQRSGHVIRVVSVDEFESLSRRDLQRPDVIYLANVYQLSESRVRELEEYVEAGGGLLIYLGDKARRDFYNDMMHRDGEGLLPVRLIDIEGDPRRETGYSAVPVSTGHQLATIFSPEIMLGARLFLWWHTEIPEDLIDGGQATLISRVDHPQRSPLMVSRNFGLGRVLVTTTGPRPNWNNLINLPVTVVALQRATEWVTRSDAGRGTMLVGSRIVEEIDLARFEPRVRLRPPAGDDVQRLVTTDDETGLTHIMFGGAEEADERARLSAAGFYRLRLSEREGGEVEWLYATNVDPRESDLTRVDAGELVRGYGVEKLGVITGDQVAEAAGTGGGRRELSRTLLTLLVMVLAAELLLGWWFGRRRS
ncbi:MAG: BatA domain-containing protein [Phycisphaeraceae bacterium]|nr:BatA domain-containing protein [Phycisphaeraceae bacterium]